MLRIRPFVCRRNLAETISPVAAAGNLPAPEFSSIGFQGKTKSTRRKRPQICVRRSESFSHADCGVHPLLDDARNSAKIRFIKNFDYKKHGEGSKFGSLERQSSYSSNTLFIDARSANNQRSSHCVLMRSSSVLKNWAGNIVSIENNGDNRYLSRRLNRDQESRTGKSSSKVDLALPCCCGSIR